MASKDLSMKLPRSVLGWLLILCGWIAGVRIAQAQDLQSPTDIDSVRAAVKRAEDLFKEKNYGQSAKIGRAHV
jgi:hypothetical protein